jgi:hypothetical protein
LPIGNWKYPETKIRPADHQLGLGLGLPVERDDCRIVRERPGADYADRFTTSRPAGVTSSRPSIALACSAQCSINQRSNATGGSAGA